MPDSPRLFTLPRIRTARRRTSGNRARSATLVGFTAALALTVPLVGDAVTPATAATTMHGLYPPGTRPASADSRDHRSVELGVRFSSTVPGTVVGIRYYKSKRNKGPHTGSLWTRDGRRLATARFTNETASGWQTVRFAKPVPISRGVSYIASYHAPAGHYASQQWAFARGRTIGRSPIKGTAGTFRYGRSAFPANTWHASGYFVEPIVSWGGGRTRATVTHSTTKPRPLVTTSAPRSTTSSSSTTSSATPSRTTSSTTTAKPTVVSSTPPPALSTTTPPPTSSTTTASTGFPDASNTGPTGTLSTYSGTFTTTAAGQVIKNMLITGDLAVRHANVTLQNSRVMGRIQSESESNLTIVDSEIGGNSCTSSDPYRLLASRSVTVLRSHFHNGGADLIWVGGGTATIKDSLVDHGCEYPGDHYDAVQLYDPGAKAIVTIDHSTIDSRSNAGNGNAAVFWADFPGAGSRLTLTNSRLAGGNYTVSLYDAKAGSGVILDVRNNTFVKGSWTYGPCADNNSVAYNGSEGVRFTGNVLSDGTALGTC